MDTINSRIRLVRTEKKLTQKAFAEKLNMSENFIWMIEKGDRIPSDRTISDICRIFSVDEVWLRTGVGEPFAPKSRKDMIDEYVGQLSGGKLSDIEELLVELMAETSADELRALANFFQKLADKKLADKMNKPGTD